MPSFELSESLQQALFSAAVAASAKAYAPYSRLRVGAAVLDAQGRIHSGCNVENAAYPQGLCAEASALGAMVLAGGTRARALVVVSAVEPWITPCGGCRQKLREFADPDTPILCGTLAALGPRFTLAQLLPASFGPEHLEAP